MNSCRNCGEATPNPRFCSSSCAAIVNNKKRPKRKLQAKKCRDCGADIPRADHTDRRKLCDACNPFYVDWGSVTYADVRGIYPYQKSVVIRQHARKVVKESGRPQRCQNCGYDKHFEVCHIKGISEFADTDLLSTINATSNLAILCRNCHWELDNHLLKLE